MRLIGILKFDFTSFFLEIVSIHTGISDMLMVNELPTDISISVWDFCILTDTIGMN